MQILYIFSFVCILLSIRCARHTEVLFMQNAIKVKKFNTVKPRPQHFTLQKCKITLFFRIYGRNANILCLFKKNSLFLERYNIMSYLP